MRQANAIHALLTVTLVVNTKSSLWLTLVLGELLPVNLAMQELPTTTSLEVVLNVLTTAAAVRANSKAAYISAVQLAMRASL